MTALRTAVLVIWVVFWVYWLVSAYGAKSGTRTARARPPGLILLVAIVVLRVFGVRDVAVHQPVLEAVGFAVFLAGLGLAVWARVHLGRNWGMPMTRKDEPEIVTSGPYRFIRHPVYSGILLATIGTALATDVYWLIVLALLGTYFIHSARVEERILSDAMPTTHPAYMAHTKMLIPFVP
jgi:protein-S-isoprenylcysteine O-methyltransferase Ste14